MNRNPESPARPSTRTFALLGAVFGSVSLTQCYAAPADSTRNGTSDGGSSSGVGGVLGGASGSTGVSGGGQGGVPSAGSAGTSAQAGTMATAGTAGSSAGVGGSGGSGGATGGTTGGSESGAAGSAGTSAGAGGSQGGAAGNPSGGNGGAQGGAAGTQGGNGGSAGSSGSAGKGGSAGSAGKGGSSGSGGGGPTDPTFILGADISFVQEQVDSGDVFVDTDGVQKNILDLLKNHGFNYIRLRVFVNPGASYGYAEGSPTGNCAKDESYCDTAHTIEIAQQVKAAGMGFLLDFHYSDTWADPGKQIIPQAWRSAGSIGALATLVNDYTQDTVAAFVAAGARPDMVQVGNEITPGMLIHIPDGDTDCWGTGSAQTSPNGIASNGNWDNLATLLTAGIDGVKAVDDSIKIMLHIENTDNEEGAVWWVDSAIDRGVDFDVLGLSCYTAWQGTPTVWRNTFTRLAQDFPNLSFVVAEYNPEKTQANDIMNDLPNGRGLGTFFWEPTFTGPGGPSLFTFSNGAFRANAGDFDEIDDIASSLGL